MLLPCYKKESGFPIDSPVVTFQRTRCPSMDSLTEVNTHFDITSPIFPGVGAIVLNLSTSIILGELGLISVPNIDGNLQVDRSSYCVRDRETRPN